MKLILAALLLAAAPSLRAQDQAPAAPNGERAAKFKQAAKDACGDDKAKLCPDAKPGAETVKCLRDHKEELSDQCKAFSAKVKSRIKERMKSVNDACKDDIKSLCAGVEPGRGRLLRCLRRNKDKVSDACKAALKPGAPGKDSDKGGDKDETGGKDSDEGSDNN